MEITPTTANQAAAFQTQLGSSAALGKEDFLKMLVTQLSNQDPLNPMEGQEFAAQLAQFSSLEALVNIEEVLAAGINLDSLLAQSMNSGVAAGLIGKQISAGGKSVAWTGERASGIRYDLTSAATSVTVTIRDENGTAVRTFDPGPQAGGRHDVDWDGRNDDGSILAAGVYTFEVNALDPGGNSIGASTLIVGNVDRVSFSQNGIRLWIGDISLAMADVSDVFSD